MTNSIRRPDPRTWFALTFVALFVTACANLGAAIGSGYVAIESLAQTIQQECRNTVPDGPCVADAAITTNDKAEYKRQLQRAKNELDIARSAYGVGNANAAEPRLEQARQILEFVKAELKRRGVLK